MDRGVIVARVLGTPAPGLAVWRSTTDPEVTGDLEDAPDDLRADDLVVLRVERDGFRWIVTEVVDQRPGRRGTAAGSSTPERATPKPRRPHAHPARPPGTVLIAWLPFTSEGVDGPGKHRPCVVLRSTDPAVVRVRPLYDPNSAQVRRHGGVALDAWRAAGLDKPSVAVGAVDVPVEQCEQTIGTLVRHDLGRLGIGAT